jgi:hypothetical protein
MKKWGIYLRAPNAFLEVVEQRPTLLRKLSTIVDVRFGTLTGMNAFYCPLPSKPAYSLFSKVDARYRIPLIRTIKDLGGFVALRSQCRRELFVCSDSKSKIKGAGTRAYISWAEKQKLDNVPWPKVGEMASRDPWYSTRDPVRGDVIFQMFVGAKHYSIANPDHFVITNNLLAGSAKNPETLDIIWAVTNSSWFALCYELYGRINLGEGALKIEKTDLDEIPLPDFSLFKKVDIKQLSLAFSSMRKRAPLPIEQDILEADRRSIDEVVGKVLQHTAQDQEAIRKAVVELSLERSTIADMRRVQSTERVRRDISEVTHEIVADFTPSGFRKFPEDFATPKGKTQKLAIPSGNMQVIRAPRAKGQADIFEGAAVYSVKADDDFAAEFPDLETVEFVHYSQNGVHREVSAPAAPAAKAAMTKEYLRYLAQTTSGIEKAVRERVLDGRMVRNVVDQILDQSGLTRSQLRFRSKR